MTFEEFQATKKFVYSVWEDCDPPVPGFLYCDGKFWIAIEESRFVYDGDECPVVSLDFAERQLYDCLVDGNQL